MRESAKLTELHRKALEQFDRIQGAVRDERQQCLNDRRFYSIAGAQWEGPLGEQFASKPKLEVNKIHLAVIRIISEYRNNRIAVDFIPKNGAENDALADACDGLFRADCQDSGAEEAFDNAFEEAVGGGYGAFRVRTAYENEEDEEDERQRIRIDPIFDADSCVFFDLDAKRQDKSDAKHCFVLTSKTRESYEEEYDDDPATWPKDIQGSEFDWSTPDVVFVAEYYLVEETSDLLRVFRTIAGEEERYLQSAFDEDPELELHLRAVGSKQIRQKRIKRSRVHKYILSGGKILEDGGLLAGKYIPIVPVYGKRWYVDSVERCMGHVRLAADPQRLKNMQLSKLAEISALSSVEKPILTPEQIAGHQAMWSEDNIKDYPYLLINPITDAAGQVMAQGPVAYTKAPEIPPAMAALLQITESDMKEILGNHDQGEKVVSNISAKAVELVQTRLDLPTFIYMSNFAKSMKRVGEIWLAMARDVYVEPGRKMKTLGEMSEPGSVELMRKTIDEKTGELAYDNDLSRAAFDVAVDVGPSSTSRRDALVRSLTQILGLTQDQETQQVLQAMVLLNLEGEGLGEIREYFRRRLVRMGVFKPSEEEAAELAAVLGQKDPNAAFLEAAADQATAKATQARADVVKTITEVDKIKADTLETLAGIDSKERAEARESLEKMGAAHPMGAIGAMNGRT